MNLVQLPPGRTTQLVQGAQSERAAESSAITAAWSSVRLPTRGLAKPRSSPRQFKNINSRKRPVEVRNPAATQCRLAFRTFGKIDRTNSTDLFLQEKTGWLMQEIKVGASSQ